MIVLTNSQEVLLLDHFGAPLKLNEAITTDVISDIDRLCRLGLLNLEYSQPMIYGSVDQLYGGNAVAKKLHEIILDDKVILLVTLTPDGILEMIARRPKVIGDRWYHRCDSVFRALIDKCSQIHMLSLEQLPKYLTHDNDVYRKAAAFRFLILEGNG